MIAIIFFLVSVAVADQKTSKNFELLVHSKDQFNFTTNNAESVLDSNRVNMLAVENGTIYTQQDAIDVDLYSVNYFKCQFGLPLDTVTPFPNGVRVLPGVGTFIPYQSGINKLYRWLFGSNDDKVFEKQEWYIFDIGSLFIFSNNGVFPGGVMGGTTYKNQSIIAFTQYTYLKDLKAGKSRTLKDIRIVRTTNREPSYQVPNEFGINQQLLLEHVVDEKGRSGYAAITVSVQQRPEKTAVLIQRNRAVLTFNYSAPDPAQCEIPWVGERWVGLQNL